MAAAPDLGSGAARRGGSSPPSRITVAQRGNRTATNAAKEATNDPRLHLRLAHLAVGIDPRPAPRRLRVHQPTCLSSPGENRHAPRAQRSHRLHRRGH